MKAKTIKLIGIILLVVVIITAIFYTGIKFQQKAVLNTKEIRTEVQLIHDINDPFSEEKVREYLKKLRVKYVDVAVAQMKLESANGTSKIFREGNNLFGMREPGRRPTTALGTRNNHAYYSHWRQSVIDYALFQAYVGNITNLATEEDWLDYIGKVYAEATAYKQTLKSIMQKSKKNDNKNKQPSN